MIVIILDDNNNGIESSGDNIKIWWKFGNKIVIVIKKLSVIIIYII